MSRIVASAIGMIIGVLIGLALDINPIWLLPFIPLAIAVVLIPISKLTLIKFIAIFLAIGFIVASYSSWSTHIDAKKQITDSTDYSINGRVLSIIENSFNRLVFNVKVYSSEQKELQGLCIRCYCLPDETLEIGDIVSVNGTFYTGIKASNPGQFDFNKYLDNQGIPGFIKSYDEPLITDTSSFSLIRLGAKIRSIASKTFNENLPDRYANLLDSITFGRMDISDDIERLFRRTGTSHILAASGFHVSIMVFSTFIILLWISGNRKIAIVGSIVIAILYASIAGFSPSVSRAIIMAGLALGAMAFGRGYARGSGLAGAVIILLLIKPEWILSPGFQLSFVSSFALFVGAPVIFKYFGSKKWYSRVVSIIATSILISILTLPILAYHFHTFSIVSPLANIIAIPLATILVPIGALALTFSWIIPPIGVFLCWVAWPIMALLETGLRLLSNPHFALLSIVILPILIWIPYYLSAITGYLSMNPPKWARKRVIRQWIIVSFIVFAVFTGGAFLGRSHPTDSEVVFLDVGHGDSCFIRTKFGVTMLIDAGGSSPFSTFDPGSRIVVPFLRYKGINKLDYVIATHEDQDHIGGLVAVLQEFPVGKMFVSGVKSDTYTSTDLNTLLKKSDITVEIPTPGKKITLDERSSLTFLGPAELSDTSTETNNHSIVTRIELDGVTFLMSGDIQSPAMEFEMMKPELLDSDIVKIPHHGGWSDKLPSWLTAVNPVYAINSDSSLTGSGAHSKTANLLKNLNIPVLSTPQHGAISFFINEAEYRIETYK
jgi:competence protein ComEC